VQLGFNLSNGVTDTLESSSILIYSLTHEFIYTNGRQDAALTKLLLKSWWKLELGAVN
jgi:hypothetical protein